MKSNQAILYYGYSDKEINSIRERLISSDSVKNVHDFGRDKPIGISDIREIQRRSLLSAGANFQYFFIWNVSSMTREAQNAFLKLLEEPPRSSQFVLFSKTIDGVLPTILSRVSKISSRYLGEDYAGATYEGAIERDDAIKFLESEIVEKKNTLEGRILKEGMMERQDVEALKRAVESLFLLNSSNTAPKYILDYYFIRRV